MARVKEVLMRCYGGNLAPLFIPHYRAKKHTSVCTGKSSGMPFLDSLGDDFDPHDSCGPEKNLRCMR